MCDDGLDHRTELFEISEYIQYEFKVPRVTSLVLVVLDVHQIVQPCGTTVRVELVVLVISPSQGSWRVTCVCWEGVAVFGFAPATFRLDGSGG